MQSFGQRQRRDNHPSLIGSKQVETLWNGTDKLPDPVYSIYFKRDQNSGVGGKGERVETDVE